MNFKEYKNSNLEEAVQFPDGNVYDNSSVKYDPQRDILEIKSSSGGQKVQLLIESNQLKKLHRGHSIQIPVAFRAK